MLIKIITLLYYNSLHIVTIIILITHTEEDSDDLKLLFEMYFLSLLFIFRGESFLISKLNVFERLLRR